MAWRDATLHDLPELFRLVRALAEYEKLLPEFVATQADYEAALFGPHPAAQAMPAEGRAALEWKVLDGNAPAIAACRAMGAVARDQWSDMRVSGDAPRALAHARR